jgi:hypothetical protein
MKILEVQRTIHHWTAFVGCVSQECKDQLYSNW